MLKAQQLMATAVRDDVISCGFVLSLVGESLRHILHRGDSAT